MKVRTLLLWVRQGKVKAFALSGTKRRVWRFRRRTWTLLLWNSRATIHSAVRAL